MANNYVHDYETLSNCFVAVFVHYTTDETKVFVVHELRNDFKELVEFLEHNAANNEWHISYNGLAFDSQITHYILQHKKVFLKNHPETNARLLYDYAQKTINKQNDKSFSDYPSWKMSIKQIDLFKMNHWDNPAKSSSLKWIQYSMDWENVLEMPIHHSESITTIQQIDEIITYCINDVLSTKKIMQLCKNQIALRQSIGDKYNMNCYSYSNTKIGSELLLKLYCEKTDKEPKNIKQTKTIRNQIITKDILFSYIEFKSNTFKEFLKTVSNSIIKNTKGDFSHTVTFKNYDFIYGTGGIHQCISPGIYEANDDFIIKDLDVASLYPSIAIVNNMYPAHLGVEFYNVYKEDIVDVRLTEKAKKEKGDKAIVEGFKEAANASYGNSNSEHSWLFDSQYTMQTTINGQLLLTMLVEELLLEFPEAILLQTNTDGATLKFKKYNEKRYYEICKAWEKKTQLILEYADYSKMIIRDVNNYIGIYTNGKVKCKGEFEWEDQQNHKASHLHKNKSFLVIPKAVYEYLVNGIKPEDYLEQNQNLYDYCGAVKSKGGWNFVERKIENGKYITTDLQKINRYYISEQGVKIVKVHNDSREIQIEAGRWMQTVCNDIKPFLNVPFESLDINKQYYLEKIYKEIENVTTQISKSGYVQGTLF